VPDTSLKERGGTGVLAIAIDPGFHETPNACKWGVHLADFHQLRRHARVSHHNTEKKIGTNLVSAADFEPQLIVK
jgi:hypothetical protein